MLKAFVISFTFACAFATMGMDLNVNSGAVNLQSMQCLVGQGVQFALIQILEENGDINPNFQGNYQNAKSAGIQYVDAYVALCENLSTTQICSDVKNNLPSGFSGQVWLCVEPYNGCWQGGSPMSFLESVVLECQREGLNLGIYSSGGAWAGVFGNVETSSSTVNRLPLWYAHYDNEQSLTDFSHLSFGGWSKPNIKQYEGNVMLCNADVNLDCY